MSTPQCVAQMGIPFCVVKNCGCGPSELKCKDSIGRCVLNASKYIQYHI